MLTWPVTKSASAFPVVVGADEAKLKTPKLYRLPTIMSFSRDSFAAEIERVFALGHADHVAERIEVRGGSPVRPSAPPTLKYPDTASSGRVFGPWIVNVDPRSSKRTGRQVDASSRHRVKVNQAWLAVVALKV